jgi:hypothetical protein
MPFYRIPVGNHFWVEGEERTFVKISEDDYRKRGESGNRSTNSREFKCLVFTCPVVDL